VFAGCWIEMLALAAAVIAGVAALIVRNRPARQQ
jgi:hypothetical protein